MTALLLWGACGGYCLQASAERLETLGPEPIEALDVTMEPGNGTFMVIDSRMTETATAAVLAGVIGAGINSAINADEDRKKAEPYQAAASQIDVAGLVETALRDTLASKDFPMADENLASHVLSVEVKDWGLTRVAFDRADMAVFLKVSVVMTTGKTKVWGAYVKESGRSSGFLSETTPERFSEDMHKLASKTGKRIAYEIIYR
jgi:hypothetical protein